MTRLTSTAVFALSVSLAAQREERDEERELFSMAVSSGMSKYASSQLLSAQPEGTLVLLADDRNSLSSWVGLSVCLGIEARLVECSFILEVSGLRTRGLDRGRETLVFTEF